jgi:hypothetical protein
MPLINFGDDGYSGPTLFRETTPADITVGGSVRISGGGILSDETNLPVDEGTVYGTASPDIGGSGFLPAITISFAGGIQNFSFNLINGETVPETYVISDNIGNSQTVTIPANTSSGQTLVGFATTGQTITITPAATSRWDYDIDNLQYNFNTAKGANVTVAKSVTPVQLVTESAIALGFSYFGVLTAPETLGLSTVVAWAAEIFTLYQINEALQAAADPFDADYQDEFFPTFPTVTLGATTNLPADIVTLAQSANTAGEKAGQYLNAIYVTLNRLSSAIQMNDATSVTLQNNALDTSRSAAKV